MRLLVEHRVRLQFDEPQRAIMQSQRLTPADFKGQTVVDWRVETLDGAEGASFRDGAGDLINTVRIGGPTQAVEIVVSGTVETTDTAGVLSGLREKVKPGAYMRPTRATRMDVALRDFAAEGLKDVAEAPQLDRAHALCHAVNQTVSHGPDDTEDGQSASAKDVLHAETGSVCGQAHLLIALALSANIPARFVYGYAQDAQPEDTRDPLILEDGTTHGWAELYIPKLGWVGFDPANGLSPDDRYVRLCSGLDAIDAAPIRMVASAVATDDTEIAVTIAATGQTQQ
ncbi:MAG: transglutaminase family protein [Pseudomonadota bacterium]